MTSLSSCFKSKNISEKRQR